MNDEKCGKCKFFKRDIHFSTGKLMKDGHCRRFPPRWTSQENLFPVIGTENWCGEFKKKDSKDEQKK